MTEQERASIEAAGRTAYYAGRPLQADPYPRGSDKSRVWRGAWMDAVHT